MDKLEILEVDIDHFRGFRKSQSFKLEKGTDLSILSGSNGFGKTSFFDAVEWGFTGKLFRYDESNEEKTKTHFINHRCGAQKTVEKAAEVSITFGNDDERYTLIRKAKNFAGKNSDYGTAKSSLILMEKNHKYSGKKVLDRLNKIVLQDDWYQKIKLEDVFSDYHLLTQDKLNYFVRNVKAPDRWKKISNLVGTHRYLKYGEQYKDLISEINGELTGITEKYNKLMDQQETYKKLYKEKNTADNDLNISSYAVDVRTTLTKIVADLNLKYSHSYYKGENIRDLLNNLKSAVKKVKILLDEGENTAKKSLEKYTQLKTELPFYLNKTRRIEQLKELLPLFKEFEDINYILDNLFVYQKQAASIIKLQNEKEENLKKYDLSLKNKSHLNQEINTFKEFISLLEKKLVEQGKLANLLGSLMLQLNLKQLSDYQIKESSIKELADIKDDALTIEKDLAKKKEGLQQLKEKLAQENNLKGNLHEILEGSLTFLSKMKAEDQEQVNCPVCNSQYEYEELVNKINNKINTGNQNTKKLRAEISSREESVGDFEIKLKNLADKKNTVLEKILVEVREMVKAKNTQIEDITYKNRKLLTRNKEIDEKIEDLKYLNENINRIIKKYNYQGDSELKAILEKRLQFLKKKLKDNQLDLEENSSETIKKKIENLEKEIILVEEKYEKIKLNQDDLKAELQEKITELENKIDVINKGLDQINGINNILKEREELLNNDQLKQNIEKTSKEIAAAEEEKKKLEKIIEKINDIKEQIGNVVANMNDEILSVQEEFINKIFKRIYPHPFFRQIRLQTDESNHGSKTLEIECWDASSETVVNPAFTFSAAQVNIVAISIFLAMALKQQCTRLNTILLDDPIQSMDDLNIISFIDVLRSCSNEEHGLNKQIILSTHEDKFYRLMMKKFRFLAAKGFYFYSYNEDGPQFND